MAMSLKKPATPARRTAAHRLPISDTIDALRQREHQALAEIERLAETG